MTRAFPWVVALALLALTLAFAACSGEEKATAKQPPSQRKVPACPASWASGWQRLADQIDAAVYCPSWMPEPLTGQIGGEWEGVHSVKKDGSYLIGFIWFERGLAEVHVNLRGYPGRTDIPKCNGQPCFSDPNGTRDVSGHTVHVYSVNRGADTWHVLYAWRDDGSLYTASQHVVPALGLSYTRVVSNLDRLMRGLVKIDPQPS